MFKPLALAAALLAATPAFADLSIRYMNSDASAPQLTTSMTTSYTTSSLSFVTSTGDSFLAYCIEPRQNFALSVKSDGVTPNFKTYTVGAFTSTQSSLLQALYSSSFSSSLSGTEQAGFQLAVWEIMRETSSSTLSVSQDSGSFFLRTAGLAGAALTDATNAQNYATNYLAAAQSYTGASLYTLMKLENAVYQDLVVATAVNAVPEPETYAMLLAGLGIVGLVARRRLPR
jgi:hypothetical protein